MNIFMVIFLILLLAVIAVLVVVWSRATKKTSQLEAELTSEKKRVTELNNAQNELNNKYEQAQKEKASAEIEKAEVVARTDNEQQNVEKLRKDNNALNEQTIKDAAQISQLETELKNERIKAEEKVAMLENMRETMEVQFKNLSQSILDEKSKTFDANSQKLLDPLRENLKEFHKRVDEIYNDETKQRASLEKQIELLHQNAENVGTKADNLAMALKGDSKMQGDWGEITLERLLEDSGLNKGLEYDTQVTTQGEDGETLRIDVLIKLPEGRHLIIDSKVSLRNFQDSIEATEHTHQKEALKKHVDAIKKHVNDLAKKHYDRSKNINAPNFVFMFMPIEPALLAAFKEWPPLFKYAHDKGIILCSPTTLMTVLRTVEHLLQIDKQNRGIVDIVQQASKIYDKFATFVETLDKIGPAIDKASDAYKTARKQLDTGQGNFMGQVEELRRLGANPKKRLPNLSEEDN